MKAAAIHRYGGPEEIQILEVPTPVPKSGQVRIRVHAAAINPVDLVTREGILIPDDEEALNERKELFAIEKPIFPMILGWDAAGIVDEVGEGVTRWKKGDRVIAFSQQIVHYAGTYAEYVLLDENVLALAPRNVGLAAASTLPLAGLTAYQAIEWLSLKPKQTLLINGPLGAVGGFALQLAAHQGITVFAVCHRQEAEFAHRLGATYIVDRDKLIEPQVRDMVAEGVDAALDVVGGKLAVDSFAAIKTGGYYATTVPDFQKEGISKTENRNITATNIWVQPNAKHLDHLSRLAELGVLTLRVAEAFKLEQVREAHQLFSSRTVRGKIVLLP